MCTCDKDLQIAQQIQSEGVVHDTLYSTFCMPRDID